jgi:hypothetical protein
VPPRGGARGPRPAPALSCTVMRCHARPVDERGFVLARTRLGRGAARPRARAAPGGGHHAAPGARRTPPRRGGVRPAVLGVRVRVGGRPGPRPVRAGPARGGRRPDLATGCGIVAPAAARAGADRVVAPDLGPLTGAVVAVNAAANGLRVEFTADDLLDRDPPAVDVVLVGDACHERRMTGRVRRGSVRPRAPSCSATRVARPSRATGSTGRPSTTSRPSWTPRAWRYAGPPSTR